MLFRYSYSETTDYIKGYLKLNPAYLNYFHSDYKSRAQVEEDVKRVNDVISNLTDNLNGSDYEKVKFFHDYLIDKNVYNQYANVTSIHPKAREITSALYYGSTDPNHIYNPVCEGYARAFKTLCDKAGIPNVLVSGYGDSEPHMWNYVQLDGEWYAVDVTWDDNISSLVGEDKSSYRYFLRGSRNFPSHVNDGSFIPDGYVFSYPTLSISDYALPSVAQTSNPQKNAVTVVKVPTVSKKINISRGKINTLKIYGLQKDAKVKYTSSRKDIIYVYQNGKIKGLKKGRATVTATVTQGGKKFTIRTVVTCK